MENGFTSQLTASVTKSPAGFRPTLRMAPKSTFIIMGVIISQISAAMGTLIWLPRPNSRPRTRATARGSIRPASTPTTIESATQSERYRSKNLSRFLATGGGVTGRHPASAPARTR